MTAHTEGPIRPNPWEAFKPAVPATSEAMARIRNRSALGFISGTSDLRLTEDGPRFGTLWLSNGGRERLSDRHGCAGSHLFRRLDAGPGEVHVERPGLCHDLPRLESGLHGGSYPGGPGLGCEGEDGRARAREACAV